MGATRGSTTLSDLVGEYVESMQSRGQAVNTLKSKSGTLRLLLAHVGNIQIKNVSGRHLDGYFAMRQARGLKPSSLNTELSVVRTFFEWCVARRYIGPLDSPVLDRKPFRLQKRDRLRVPQARFGELLDACESPRDRAIVSLGLYLFLRQSEIRSLKVGDVDLDGCVCGDAHAEKMLEAVGVSCQSAHNLRVVVHKTGDYDDMPISRELAIELRRWFDWYRRDQETAVLNVDWYLCPAREVGLYVGVGRGKLAPVARDNHVLKPTCPLNHVHRAAQRALAKMGYPLHEEGHAGNRGRSLNEGIHTLRRSGARAYFDHKVSEGYDGALREVQVMLHHASGSTTEGYLGLTLDRSRRDRNLRGRPMFGAASTTPEPTRPLRLVREV